jgi:hypothetical protein
VELLGEWIKVKRVQDLVPFLTYVEASRRRGLSERLFVPPDLDPLQVHFDLDLL